MRSGINGHELTSSDGSQVSVKRTQPPRLRLVRALPDACFERCDRPQLKGHAEAQHEHVARDDRPRVVVEKSFSFAFMESTTLGIRTAI